MNKVLSLDQRIIGIFILAFYILSLAPLQAEDKIAFTPTCLRSSLNRFLAAGRIRRSADPIRIIKNCRGNCYVDASDILKSMQNLEGYDVSEAKVLFMYRVDEWNYHVVVEYNGLIFDAQDMNGDIVLAQYARDYFSKHLRNQPFPGWMSEWEPAAFPSGVQVVPGESYLKNSHPNYYRMPKGQTLYPVQKLDDVVKRLELNLPL